MPELRCGVPAREPAVSLLSEREPEVVGTSLTRRKALAAVVTGLAVAPMLRAQNALGKSYNERLIRPPRRTE
jgi:hypothetical protein